MQLIVRSSSNENKILYDITKQEDFAFLHSQLNSSMLKNAEIFDIEVKLEKYDDETIKQIEDLSSKMPKHLSTSFIIEDKHSRLKCSDLEMFIDLEDALVKSNVGLYFDGGLEHYQLTEVIHAQEQIENFTKKIKDLEASPFEKYLIIYNFLTNKVYKENRINTADSRDIIAVLNGDNIVCVGYSHMLQRLCNEVGIEGYEQNCYVYYKEDGKENVDGHANNIVKIKDEKYGIDGLFYADACWDSVDKGKEDKKTFAYALLPLSDKNNMLNVEIELESSFHFFYDAEMESVACKMALYNLKDYNIDVEIKEQQDISIYLDKERRTKACEKVEELLNQNNVSADFYAHANGIPEICSAKRLLALCMEEPVDQKRIDEAIATINKIQEEGNSYYAYEHNLIVNYISTDEKQDIYKYLNKLAEQENITENVKIEWHDGFSFNEVMEAVKQKDNKALKKMGFKKIVEQVEPKIPSEWERVVENHNKIQTERRIKKDITKFIGKSEPISIETFEKAITRCYELSCKDLKKAEQLAKKAIEDTISLTELKFTKDATNCFV